MLSILLAQIGNAKSQLIILEDQPPSTSQNTGEKIVTEHDERDIEIKKKKKKQDEIARDGIMVQYRFLQNFAAALLRCWEFFMAKVDLMKAMSSVLSTTL